MTNTSGACVHTDIEVDLLDAVSRRRAPSRKDFNELGNITWDETSYANNTPFVALKRS
jgi:hypothetical protein